MTRGSALLLLPDEAEEVEQRRFGGGVYGNGGGSRSVCNCIKTFMQLHKNNLIGEYPQGVNNNYKWINEQKLKLGISKVPHPVTPKFLLLHVKVEPTLNTKFSYSTLYGFSDFCVTHI